MLHSSNSEFIVATSNNGIAEGKMVDRSIKENFMGQLIGRLKNYRANHPELVFQNETANAMNSVLVRCPMVLNMIATAGYKNVLFIGYYDHGDQNNWLVEPSDLLEETVQYENRNITHVMKPDICNQFLPIVHKQYGYEFSMTTVSPQGNTLERHRAAIHDLYTKWNVDITTGNKQYKHGTTSFVISVPEVKYDCIVFAGVPKKYGNTEFTATDIATRFDAYTTQKHGIFDIKYELDDVRRYTDTHRRKEVQPLVTKAFSTRAEWDQEVTSGRQNQFAAYERDIKWFEINKN